MLGAERRGAEALLWTIKPFPTQAVPDPAGGDDHPPLPVISTDEDLDKFLWDYFEIKLPNVRCCPTHRTPWEAFHDAYFARSPVSIWKASRGFGGKTFTLGLLAMVEFLTLRADVNILGGSGVQSKRVLEHINAFWEVPTAPKWCLVGEPGSQVQKTIWGNRVQALMASTKSVRGPHPQRLRLDEADETKISLIGDALGQPMSKGTVLAQVVLSSTHQYADGPMTWALKQAALKGWPVYEWCLEETKEPHGWLSLAEVERKQAIMTQLHWDTEVLLQEPSAEGRAIDTQRVEQAFRTDVQLEDPEPESKYGSGGDWAKKKNWTYICTLKKNSKPYRVVFVKRAQKQPWPLMVSYFDDAVRAYPGTAVHDNTGLGQVVHDLLHVDAEPFNMVGRDRADLLSEYIAALEKGEVIWPRDDPDPERQAALSMAYSEHKYASRDDIYKGTKDGSGKHHLPDSISSAAFAYRAVKAVTAMSASIQPEPQTSPTLSRGLQRGRLSNYIMGRHTRTDDDDT